MQYNYVFNMPLSKLNGIVLHRVEPDRILRKDHCDEKGERVKTEQLFPSSQWTGWELTFHKRLLNKEKSLMFLLLIWKGGEVMVNV